jgi:hypothetical protein
MISLLLKGDRFPHYEVLDLIVRNDIEFAWEATPKEWISTFVSNGCWCYKLR